MSRPLRVGTDCSGIEAPIQALLSAGISFVHEWACEVDPMAAQSLRANYYPKRFYTDIFTRDHHRLPSIDLYVCGFPCQSFSMLGQRAGLSDRRGIVFFACVDTIRACLPKIFILENVPGLLTHDSGRTFQHILKILNSIPGYTVYHEILNTMDFGLPQHRRRVFIVGIRGRHRAFRFPEPVPLRLSVLDILEKKKPTDPKLYQLTSHKKALLSELLRRGKIDRLDEPWLVNLNVSSADRAGCRRAVCPCLLAGEGGNCIYYLTSMRRRLTPREYLRLQGFPDSFRIVVPPRFIYKQAGNSMSVPVLAALYRGIFQCF